MTRDLTIADLDMHQALFLRHFLDAGGRPEHAPEAAKRAGLATDDVDAARVGAILLGSDKITKAIKNEVSKRFGVATGEALQAILNICRNGRSEQTRLAAAKEILDRAGLVVMSRNAVVTANFAIEDWLDQLDGRDRARDGEAIEAAFVIADAD